MLVPELKAHLEDKLMHHIGTSSGIEKVSSVGGGSINRAYRLTLADREVFVKINLADLYPDMFEAEKKGLDLMRNSTTLTVPRVLFIDTFETESILVMEYISERPPAMEMASDFGARLAEMHRCSTTDFGLDYDNYIGSLSQSNTKHHSWEDFFIEERLTPQLRMAVDGGKAGGELSRTMDALFGSIGDIFPREKPSLIHGDLWSGNYIIGPDGKACLIDPAVYYGHREMDIGMSRLFSGFDKDFYMAYHATWPLEMGWEERVDICNLYPLMVHVNLFGGGYLEQVKGILKRFV